MAGCIRLIDHKKTEIVEFDSSRFQLAESRDFIELIPVGDNEDLHHKYYKPYWQVLEVRDDQQ